MKKWFIVLSGYLVSTAPLFAATYFVSVDGKDINPGTKAKPFRTIQKATDVMSSGDTCVIRGGTYRETVRPIRSGQPERPIRFVAAEGEKVILDGTEPISGTWTQHSGNIYQTKVAETFEQLFVDRAMMIEARWPNMRFEQIFDRSAWAKAGQGSTYGRMIDPALAKTGVDWTGARVTLNVAHQFFTWSRIVDQHTRGGNIFTYPKTLDFITNYADKTTPWEDDYYYLSGKLEALDTPTEWFLDDRDGQLYLWAEDGKSPAGRKAVYKKRDYAFDISRCHYIEVRGLHFFATAFRFNCCSHCAIENCRLVFPSYSRKPYEGIQTVNDFEEEQRCASVVGEYNAVRHTIIAYASGTGLYIKGNSNTVENCIIHDVSWNGSLRECALLVLGQGPGPGGSVVRQSTFYNAGNAILVYLNGSHTIEYNHIYSGGRLCKDVALLGTWNPPTAGSIVRYNWVHGCHTEGYIGRTGSGGIGIRGDDQTRGLTVHHNVVWDCGWRGINIKGDHNRVFNNTIFDIGPKNELAQQRQWDLCIHTRAEPEKPWRKQFPLLKAQNANSLFYNNAVGNIVWYFEDKPLPVDKVANNLEFREQLPKSWLADAKKIDFRPRKKSPLIDAGRVIPGFTDNYNGKAPDIGAYEYGGKQWKPGSDLIEAKWVPLHATVASGDRQAVEDLLAKGADVKAKGEGGVSTLHVAAGKGQKDIAELLITRGADVNEKAKFDPWKHGGWTPLYFAIWGHHSEMAELLLAKGADVNVKDERNLMPLHLALYSGPIDLAELLVARDADVNAGDTWGQTPLHIAAKKGHTDIARMLLDKGAKPNAKEIEHGNTPLHMAANGGHKAVAELLISRGVDVNAKTRDGETPVSLAKGKGHTEVMELLWKHGAKEQLIEDK